jgi:hypothetical protein
VERHYDITAPTIAKSVLSRWDAWDGGRQMLPRVVKPDAPLRVRQVVEILARYFRREFSYDMVNYVASEKNARCQAWLWVKDEWPGGLALGHAVFWQQDFEGRPEREWELGSVWFHPYARGHGHLTTAWPIWQEHYGPFWICTPWSPAMRSFLAKTTHHFPDGATPQDWLAR